MSMKVSTVRRCLGAVPGWAGAARLGACAAAILIIAVPARAHDHKNTDGTMTSWYPKECCDDGDCRPVTRVVRARQGLWMTTTDGYTVLVGPNDKRLPSRDMRWHICISRDIEALPETVRCIFEPPDT